MTEKQKGRTEGWGEGRGRLQGDSRSMIRFQSLIFINQAMVVERKGLWFMDDGALTYDICEDSSPIGAQPIGNNREILCKQVLQ